MTASSRALVLSGGGTAGAAWMAGIISGLQQHGIDLGEADLIVGTSAGARVGTQLATGTLNQIIDMFRRSGMPVAHVYATLPEWLAASMRIIGEAPDEQEAARRIAALGPLGERLASSAERRNSIVAQLPVRHWPDRRLLISAVDAGTGERVAFDASSRVDLIDAVAASGALPGIHELVTINGRSYADGGVYSLYSADLAAGCDAVVVLSPVPVNDYLQAKLEAEMRSLGSAHVHVVTADKESLAAIGPDANSASAAPAALDAGTAQAHREIRALEALWPRRSSPVG